MYIENRHNSNAKPVAAIYLIDKSSNTNILLKRHDL